MPKMKQTSRATYEAALDLGASPLYAFWKVKFPDIMPGVLSGFLLAFTMSLDDFIITHLQRERHQHPLHPDLQRSQTRNTAFHVRPKHRHISDRAHPASDRQFPFRKETR